MFGAAYRRPAHFLLLSGGDESSKMEEHVGTWRMQEPGTPRPSSPAGAPDRPESSRTLHVRAERPIDISFSFEQRQSRVGVGASFVSHVLMWLIALAVMRYVPDSPALATSDERPPNDIVWIAEPGPGGGGGGGGDNTPEPPRKVELPGKDKITVPVEKAPEPKPEPPKEEPPPLESLNIPAQLLASAQVPLPGALQSENLFETARGSGSGTGSGTGQGSGIGSGTGPGLGPGTGGGFGGGVYRRGSGVTDPQVIREVKPQYTADAMRAKVQGSVYLECIVMPDGTVGDVKVTRSLDPTFGLDQEAIKAARQWRFVPGTLQGKPVAVVITIELTFTLR